MYGQPGMPMQPGMMPGMMPGMQPGMPMQPGMMPGMMPGMPMVAQPIFKQIAVGSGIDMNEFQRMVQCATSVYQMQQKPLSTHVANAIKTMLGGDWLCVVQPFGKNYDFCLSTVKGGDFMSFTLDSTYFQICRLK